MNKLLEGYSFGSKGKVFHIAENTGILKYKIHNMGVPLEVIPPTTVKKFATGQRKCRQNDDAQFVQRGYRNRSEDYHNTR